MRTARFATALLALAALPALEAEVPSCQRSELEGPTKMWSFDGSWDRAGEDLLLVDTVGSRVLQYRRDGSFVRTIVNPGQGRLEFRRPNRIEVVGDRYLLQDGTRHWLWLDQDLKPVEAFGTQEMRAGFPLGDKSPHDVWIEPISTVGGTGIGFGAAVFDDGSKFGWFVVDLLAGKVESFSEEAPDYDHWSVDRSLGPTQAAAGASVFQLRWGEPTRIRRVYPGPPQDLEAFPEGFRAFVTLPAPGGPGSTAAQYEIIEGVSVATGLYGKGDLLYLLTRKPEAMSTRWDLHRIDPAADRLLGSLRLPTSAPHVFLVPGPREWAVVEKDSIVVGGEQAVLGIVWIPSAVIEAPAPERPGSPETLECADVAAG